MVEGYLQWAASTGASFVPAWSNANVAVGALAVFTVFFLVSAFSGREWLFDIAFMALVVGGIMVPWPGMVAMSIAAMIVAVALSFLHRAVAPEQSARIQAEAEGTAAAGTEEFAREILGDGANLDRFRRDRRE